MAAGIDAESYQQFLEWKSKSERSVADAFRELRRICEEEDYELVIPPRVDRPNAFLEMLEEEEDDAPAV